MGSRKQRATGIFGNLDGTENERSEVNIYQEELNYSSGIVGSTGTVLKRYRYLIYDAVKTTVEELLQSTDADSERSEVNTYQEELKYNSGIDNFKSESKRLKISSRKRANSCDGQERQVVYSKFAVSQIKEGKAVYDKKSKNLTFHDWGKSASHYREFRMTKVKGKKRPPRAEANKKEINKEKEALKKALTHGGRAFTASTTTRGKSGRTEKVFKIIDKDIRNILCSAKGEISDDGGCLVSESKSHIKLASDTSTVTNFSSSDISDLAQAEIEENVDSGVPSSENGRSYHPDGSTFSLKSSDDCQTETEFKCVPNVTNINGPRLLFTIWKKNHNSVLDSGDYELKFGTYGTCKAEWQMSCLLSTDPFPTPARKETHDILGEVYRNGILEGYFNFRYMNNDALLLMTECSAKKRSYQQANGMSPKNNGSTKRSKPNKQACGVSSDSSANSSNKNEDELVDHAYLRLMCYEAAIRGAGFFYDALRTFPFGAKVLKCPGEHYTDFTEVARKYGHEQLADEIERFISLTDDDDMDVSKIEVKLRDLKAAVDHEMNKEISSTVIRPYISSDDDVSLPRGYVGDQESENSATDDDLVKGCHSSTRKNEKYRSKIRSAARRQAYKRKQESKLKREWKRERRRNAERKRQVQCRRNKRRARLTQKRKLEEKLHQDQVSALREDPGYACSIEPYRKPLVALSNNVYQPSYVERMSPFLKEAGHDILQNYTCNDSLEIHEGLIALDNDSLFSVMFNSLSRQVLVKLSADFNRQHGVRKAPFGLRNLPLGMIQRKPELDAVLETLNSGKGNVGIVGARSRDVIGICGMAGSGKTILAQSVAWTMSKYREVIWLESRQTLDSLALVNELINALGETRSVRDLPTAQAWICENTENRDCLVILDNVCSFDHACVFSCLAGNCQFLMTTRDAEIVRILKGSVYMLGNMAKDESQRLLYQSAQVQETEDFLFQENFKKIIEALLDECCGLPLSLALVGSSLMETRKEEDWLDVLDDLQNANLEVFRCRFPKSGYPYDNLFTAIDLSFQRLEKYEQDKFLDLAIFAGDADIPSAVLKTLWTSDKSRGPPCRVREVRRILYVLERKSLIQRGPVIEGEMSYRVHNLVLDFARGKLRKLDDVIIDIQIGFLEILRHQCAEGKWSNFPRDDKYFFTYLPYHLYSAGAFEELSHLFFDFQWLRRKVKVTGLASLISDFRFLHCASDEVKLLKSSLMLSSDIIEKKPDSLGAQLLGRLAWYESESPNIDKLLASVRDSNTDKRLLIPLHSCLSVMSPVGPLIKTFRKHNSGVLSLAFCHRYCHSSLDTIVISASTDRLIKLHELETGKEFKVLSGHNMAVCCLAVSHSGTKLASGSYDTTTRIWNLDSYMEIHVLEGRGGIVNALSFSADDRRLFTGSCDGSLRVWRVSTGNLLSSIPAHDGQIRGLCMTSNCLLMATASQDHTVKLWNVETLNLEATLHGHTDTIYAVTFTSDSKMLVSASGDKTLKVWDLHTVQEVRTLRGHLEEIYSVALTPDNERVISGGKDKIVRLWCLATGKLLFCFRGHSQSIRFVIATPDGSKALSGSQDKSFRVWDIDTTSMKKSEFLGHSRDVMDITKNETGSVFVSPSMAGILMIWHCETAEKQYTLRGCAKQAISVAVSPDEHSVVSLAKDSIKIWNVSFGQMVSDIDMQSEPRLVRFNWTGKLVLIGCENNQVSIWSWLKNELLLRTLILPAFTTIEITSVAEGVLYTCRNSEVSKIALQTNAVLKLSQGPNPCCTLMVILPDGEAILAGIVADSSFIYCELSSCREIRYNADHPHDTFVTAIDITSNEKLVLSGSSLGTISLVGLESSEVLRSYKNPRLGKAICFVATLKTSRFFVFIDETNTIELRNLENDESTVLGQLDSDVTSISPVGLMFVLTGCENGELVLFDTSATLGRWKGHVGAVTALAIREYQNFVFFVSGCTDGCVKLWDLSHRAPPIWVNIWCLENIHNYPVTSLAFNPDAEDIVAGSRSDDVIRVNLSGVVQRYACKGCGMMTLRVIGRTLIVACDGGRSSFQWHLEHGYVVKRIYGSAEREQLANIYPPSGHVVSKDSHHSLMYWNLPTGNTIRCLNGHIREIRALAFLPEGEIL